MAGLWKVKVALESRMKLRGSFWMRKGYLNLTYMQGSKNDGWCEAAVGREGAELVGQTPKFRMLEVPEEWLPTQREELSGS